MDPDFSSLSDRVDKDASIENESSLPYRPSESATEMASRRQGRAKRSFQRTVRNVTRYSGYVLLIGSLGGSAQTVTALFNGVPLADAAWFTLWPVVASVAGAFIGLGVVCALITSPVVPLGPVVVVRGVNDEGIDEGSKFLLPVGIIAAAAGACVAVGLAHHEAAADNTLCISGLGGVGVAVAIVILHAFAHRRVPPRANELGEGDS